MAVVAMPRWHKRQIRRKRLLAMSSFGICGVRFLLAPPAETNSGHHSRAVERPARRFQNHKGMCQKWLNMRAGRIDQLRYSPDS